MFDSIISKIGRRFGGMLGAGVLALGLLSGPASAGPVNPIYISGSVTIIPIGLNGWLIIASDGSIINYTSFDIGSGEFVNFFLPGSHARVLNRITGDFDGTQINGSLTSNGIVYFVNPAGIFFGSGAVVNVGGIYAAAGNISDVDFHGGTGIYRVDRFTNLNGQVINNGTITGNLVHLLGQQVANHGTINVTGGGILTMLAAQNEIILTEAGGRVSVRLDGVDLTRELFRPGSGVPMFGTPGVENTGTINAPGGQVVLGAGDMYSLAIRNTGAINASGGITQMTALAGTVHLDGSIQTGDLAITGDSIYLDSDIQADTARFNDAVVLGSNVMISGDGGGSAMDIVFVSTVDSATGAETLGIDSAMTTFEDHVGQLTRLGSLTLSGEALVLGNILTNNGISFGGDVTLSGAGAQLLDAGSGLLIALNGADITKTTAGSLTLAGVAGIQLGGNVVTGSGDLVFMNDVTLNGTGASANQLLSAGGTGMLITVDGVDLSKTTAGNLVLQGLSGIQLGGNATTVDGNLVLSNDVVLNGTGGAASQLLSAGGSGLLIALDGVDLTKTTSGSLTLTGIAGIQLGGDVTTSDGSIWFTNDVTLNGTGAAAASNQLISAGGGGSIFTLNGVDLTKTTSGSLTMFANGPNGIILGGNASTTDGDLLIQSDVILWGTGGAANQMLSAGGSGSLITVDGVNLFKVTSGSLSLQGMNGIFLGGSAFAFDGDLVLMNDVVLNGTGGSAWQYLWAGGSGSLIAQDGVDLTKTTAGNLSLHGENGIFLGGNASTVDGNLTLENDVTLNGTGGAANQVLAAGGSGALIALDGVDLSKVTTGSLTLAGDAGIQLGGNATTTNGNLVLVDDVTLNGTGAAANQLLSAGGAGSLWTLNGVDLSKTTSGSLTLAGNGPNGILLGGNATTVNGDLVIQDSVLLYGTGGAANQLLSAGGGQLITVDGVDLFKASSGSLTLEGENGIQLGGNAVTSDGDLVIRDDVVLNGTGGSADQLLSAGGSGSLITEDGADLEKTTAGSLTLFGQNGIVLGGNTSTVAGDIDLQSDVLFNGTGDQFVRATGGALTAQALSKTSGGDLTLGGQGGIIVDGTIGVDAGNLWVEDAIRLNGGVVNTSGAQTYFGTVELGNSTVFTATGVDFQKLIYGNGHDLTVNAGLTYFWGGAFGVGKLLTDAAGYTLIGGNISTVGGMEFRDKVLLTNNVALKDVSPDTIIFGQTIDGPFNLLVQSAGDIRFGGNIGEGVALARFETISGGTVEFDATLIRAVSHILLNYEVDSLAIPVVATIGASGSLQIVSLTGNVQMGQNQKLTAVGDLTIDAANGVAILGDMNSLGDMTVTANAIVILSRAAGSVQTSTGNLESDRGVDFVAGGRFFFNVVPIVLGDGIVQFANSSGNGDGLGTLDDFIMRQYGDVSAGALRQATFFDLRAKGPTTTDLGEALAALLERESEVGDVNAEDPIPANIREALARDLNIQPRVLDPEELALFSNGRALFLDNIPTSVDPGASRPRVVVNRLQRRLAEAVVGYYQQLTTDRTPEQVKSELTTAWNAYAGSGAGGPEGFAAYLAESGKSQALADLQLLQGFLTDVRIIGLTPAELQRPEEVVLSRFRPDAVSAGDFEAAIMSATGSE